MNTAVDMDKTEKQATLIKTNEVLIKEGGNWFGLYSNPRVITLPKPEYSKEVLYWKPAIDRETCNAAIEQIRDHFAEGQTYQVNYTMLLQADFTGSTWDFFLRLAQTQNNCAAYIDLGRIAKIGSVQVPELFSTERYLTLWQMTSTVTAKTVASLTKIFTALFPSASITGAPKASTMKIIARLETTPRGIYTGSIGYIAPNRKATFNVTIRTALIDRETRQAAYGVGGGIVWDSTSADEYAEALLKAQVLTEQSIEFSLLETILWTPEEGYFLREKHIERLLDSAHYFAFPGSKPELSEYLDRISSNFDSAQHVRLLLDRFGTLNTETAQYQPTQGSSPLKVCLARHPIDSNNRFLFHETTHREIYKLARKEFTDFDDVLLYNESGELTDFTIGNLVVELKGRPFTPPISCGSLLALSAPICWKQARSAKERSK